jgi:hypothetical protein
LNQGAQCLRTARETVLKGIPMDSILKWLTQYSPPAVLLIGLAAASLYMFQMVTEKAISANFDKYKKEIELRLQKRSNFEERILLDRYTIIRDIHMRLTKVMTNINRTRSGAKVEGLVKNGDIVPLTEVFEILSVNKYLITERIHKILWDKGQIAIKFFNAQDKTALDRIAADSQRLEDEFSRAMNDVFGIEKITWEPHE